MLVEMQKQAVYDDKHYDDERWLSRTGTVTQIMVVYQIVLNGSKEYVYGRKNILIVTKITSATLLVEAFNGPVRKDE